MRRIRAAAHVHSSWSYDGRWSLSQIALTFRRLGYDAVLLAEHDRGFDAERWSAYRRGCADVSTESMLLVPGIEYSDPSNSVHVPVWGDVPFLGAGIETGELLSRSEEAGAAAIIAHIGRREVWRILQDEWLNRVVGVELWNRKYDGYAPNQPAARLLQERSDLLPFVSLDFHTARQLHPLAMILELTSEPGEAQVLDAIQRGRVSPIAFGIAATRLAESPALPAMQVLERSRRRVRALVASS